MSHSGHHGHDMGSMSMADNTTTTTMASMNMNHDAHSGHSGHDHGSMAVGADAAGQSSGEGHHNMMMHMYFHGGEKETILFEFWSITEIGGLIGSMVAIFFLAFVYEALKFYREHLYRHSFQTVQVNTVSVPVENGSGAVKETHKTVQIAATSTSNYPYASEVIPIIISQTMCTCPAPERPEAKMENRENANVESGAGAGGTTCRTRGSMSRTTTEIPPIIHRPRGFYKVKMMSWMHIWQTCLHVIQVVLSYFLMLIFMTYNVWLCLAVAAGAGAGYFFFGWKKSLVVDITEHCH